MACFNARADGEYAGNARERASMGCADADENEVLRVTTRAHGCVGDARRGCEHDRVRSVRAGARAHGVRSDAARLRRPSALRR